MNPAQPTVFVVDDDTSFLTAIARLLKAGGYAFQGFASATEFLAHPPGDQPGCIIVDLHMPGPSGLDLQDALAAVDHPLPLIFLTGHGDIPTSVHAIKQGAEDFLTKPVKGKILFAAIERALARDARQRAQRTRRRELLDRFDALTSREREVLGHVVRGQLNKQIAGNLDVSERTIKAHRASIMAKLQVQSVAELVRLTEKAGVLEQGAGGRQALQGEAPGHAVPGRAQDALPPR
ncbi:MAG TPA: response regulator [Verrucomicrobiota bacterium]|nr:response regulator [Verrucomicrobiota bacterium]HRZ35018.1 response regulator [Candidatus Paceibacterota bacterium]